MPLVLSLSALDPASIQTPTVDVCAHGECSVAICASSQYISGKSVTGKSDTYSQSIGECGALGIDALGNGSCKTSSEGWAPYRVQRGATSEMLV